MVIAHNLMATNANRIYGINDKNRAKSTEKLSSGYKINRAADDAAGLTISEKMRRQIRGLNQASRNVQDGISLIQVAEGGLTESHAILQRMNELCVQAANDTNTSLDRQAIQNEINDLKMELTRIAETTEFNQEIHPLNSGYELPDFIKVKPVTFTNNSPESTDILVANGKEYKVGESFSMECAHFENASGYDISILNFNIISGNGIGMLAHNPDVTSGTYSFDHDGGGGNNVYSVNPLTLDDFHVDENGYVYLTYPGETSGINPNHRTYVYEGAYCGLVTDPQTRNPTTNPVILEAAGVAKAKGNTTPIKIQASSEPWQAIEIPKVNATAKALGVNKLDVMSFENAGASMEKVQKAIDTVSGYRSTFGAIQNRMEHTIKNLDNAAENTQNAESRIRDTDMAKEMVEFSKTSILLQVTQSMQAQANQAQQGVLQLLS